MRPMPSTRPRSSTSTRSNRCIGTWRWTGLISATRDASISASGTWAGGRRRALEGVAEEARGRCSAAVARPAVPTSASAAVPPSTGNRHTPSSTAWPSSSQSINAPDSATSSSSNRVPALRRVRSAASVTRSRIADWSPVVVKTASSTDRTRSSSASARVGSRRVSSSISRKPSACSAPRAGPISAMRPVSSDRRRPKDTASNRTGRTPARCSSSVRDVTVKSRSSQATWMTVPTGRPPSSAGRSGRGPRTAISPGPAGVDELERVEVRSDQLGVGAERRGRALAPRGRLQRTAWPRPAGSAARSSSWSVTLFLDGSATSATRPPGVEARVGRSAAIDRDRGRGTHGGTSGRGCLG